MQFDPMAIHAPVFRFLIHYYGTSYAAHRRSSHPWVRILLYANMCRCVHSTTKIVAAKGFNAHHDSRHRWGETVTGVSLGRNRTLSFIPSNKLTKSQYPPRDLEGCGGNAALGSAKEQWAAHTKIACTDKMGNVILTNGRWTWW